MPSISREIALSLYRWSTMRTRLHLAKQFEASGTYPAAVLFYHRVADTHPNAWSISNANFIQHLNWVQQHARFASLSDIRKSQSNGHRRIAMVSLTFDDGYSDNCQRAIPEILDRKIPCTYFVSTHFVESGEPFPHDRAAGVPLRPNTIEEIRRMASQGITIGGHTHTHLDLGKTLSSEQLRREISDSRKKLQDWSQQPVSYFAFPYGLKENISQQSIDAVLEAGFECFLTAAGGLNWPGEDTIHLQRIHGDPGMAALTNWLTLDPRKLNLKSPVVIDPSAFQHPSDSSSESGQSSQG
ncbi:polysaccharide deacetylase family protein [Pirellulaceae bacterium SH467]